MLVTDEVIKELSYLLIIIETLIQYNLEKLVLLIV